MTEKKNQKSYQNHYKYLFDFAVDGILIGSPEGIIIKTNEAFCNMISLPMEEIVGKHIKELPFDPKSIINNPFRFDLIRAGNIVNTQRSFITPNGIIYVEMRSKMMTDGTYQSIFRDITLWKIKEKEKEKLQEELIQSQKIESIGRLAGGIAHDFNNMLSVIIGRTELALLKLKKSESVISDLEEISKAARRSADLVKQLLLFARKQNTNPTIININEKINYLSNILKTIIGDTIEFNCLLDKNLWNIKIDSSQLDQIIINLITNAKYALSNKGMITIKTENIIIDKNSIKNSKIIEGNYVKFSIEDNGCGIDDKILPYIFEPFFTTKTLGNGTGLGLSIVYGAVKQHNGFINVTSKINEGTSFNIYFLKYDNI